MAARLDILSMDAMRTRGLSASTPMPLPRRMPKVMCFSKRKMRVLPARREGTMWVDRDLCTSCGKKGGVGSLMRAIGMDELVVHSPSGVYRITAARPSVPIAMFRRLM